MKMVEKEISPRVFTRMRVGKLLLLLWKGRLPLQLVPPNLLLLQSCPLRRHPYRHRPRRRLLLPPAEPRLLFKVPLLATRVRLQEAHQRQLLQLLG